MKIRKLADVIVQTGASSNKHMNVCIVSSEFLGPVKNGGIGTATSALATQLVADGHPVTLLYTYAGYGQPISGDRPWQHWVDELAAQGIVLKHVPHHGDYRAWREASWLVKEFIGQGDFDLVYFNDHYGSGYYSLLAKRSGLAPFCDQLHCVLTHGSMEWVFNLNDYYATRKTDVEWMGLERRSVELADVVIGPSTYLLREYERYGWGLPEQTFHQPYPVFQNPTKVDYEQSVPINEIVFFGRLEVRKGLWLFCEALDQLAERFPTTDVTFLGRVTEFSGISSALQIINRTADWPFRVRLFRDFDQPQALSYLRQPGRLAVMPSLADNSPCAVYECMEAGIPFLTTCGSGADELVDPACWEHVMVRPNVASLTEKLIHVLEHGARVGRPRFDPVQNLATWSAWHRLVAENRGTLLQTRPVPTRAHPIGPSEPALIVVIDRGTCSLALLIDNLSSHIRRFGERARYLVLSSRRADLQRTLFEMFNPGSENSAAPPYILDPSAIDEAQRLISASAFTFFTDAETELLTSFFISALERLRSEKPVVVSCAVAVRRSAEKFGKIEELPTGDIPGLAALGEPIGGSVWATTAASLADDLSALQFYDPQLDTLARSSALGQVFMAHCRTKGVSIHLLPVVGGVETREDETVQPHRSLADARQAAKSLGVPPSVYKGGAAWFAISALCDKVEPPQTTSLQDADLLPQEHPYRLLQTRLSLPPNRDVGHRPDVPELAAALGRAELALQLEAATGPLPGQTRDLVDIAARSLRLRPRWNLLSLLTSEDVFEFGVGTTPQRVKDTTKTGDAKNIAAPRKFDTSPVTQWIRHLRDTAARAIRPPFVQVSAATSSGFGEDRQQQSNDPAFVGNRPGVPSPAADASSAVKNARTSIAPLETPIRQKFGRVYVDGRRAQITANKINPIGSLRESDASKILFVDVPLCGHSRLVAKLCTTSPSDSLLVRMQVIDQRQGNKMADCSTQLTPQDQKELSIPLHNVYGRAAVALEFSGAENTDLTINSLVIE